MQKKVQQNKDVMLLLKLATLRLNCGKGLTNYRNHVMINIRGESL